MKTTAAIFLLPAICTLALAGEKVTSEVQWLKRQHARLAGIKSPASVINGGLSSSKDKNPDGLYIYYPSRKGLIRFEDKTWIMIISHSIHAEDGLGDLTLIRTSAGPFYVNRGHVCEKLILESKEKITSLDAFLRTIGKGPKAEPMLWEPYKDEQAAGREE